MSVITCLAIESSCDETAVAIVDSNKNIIANQIFSQIKLHQPYNGVVPEVASRSHLEVIDTLVQTTLDKVHVTLDDINLIGVTRGPGLIGGLLVGVVFAKSLAYAAGKPLMAVNHLEGHALTARLTNNVAYPFLLLLVSGGHSQIILVNKLNHYTVLGATHDDAVGEAFDKLAKMLGLPYPGGPAIEQLALTGNPNRFNLPKPLLHSGDANFSLSGLKTALARKIQHEGVINNEQDRADLAASFQQTVATIMQAKLNAALDSDLFKQLAIPVNSIVVAGGVAANKSLREALNNFAKEKGMEAVFPPIKLCTDNASMIAWSAIERYQAGFVLADLNLEPRNRWGL